MYYLILARIQVAEDKVSEAVRTLNKVNTHTRRGVCVICRTHTHTRRYKLHNVQHIPVIRHGEHSRRRNRLRPLHADILDRYLKRLAALSCLHKLHCHSYR